MNMLPENDNAWRQPGEVIKQNNLPVDCIYPRHNTQQARLLGLLLQQHRCNPLKAWVRLGIYRTSAVVLVLRRLGWPVETGRFDVNNRFDEPCHVADYRLPLEAIERAGEFGQRFAADEFALMEERRAA